MMWLVIAMFIVLLVGVLGYWRVRKRRQSRLISFVALLRESVSFDPAVLARQAGKAWNADLGDGTSEGADGFVAGADAINTIMHGGRAFLINNFPRPYVDDPEEASNGISDLRLRALFREHQAWFSCDALGVDGTNSDDEIRDWYRRLGKLFAELLDDNCLMIYMPDSSLGYPINNETEAALRSDDPVGSLQATLMVPIIQVPTDDPLMKQAEQQARQDWPKFVTAYEAKSGTHFSVKAPITHGDNTEFIWISVTTIEGDLVYGELGNDPGNLGSLKLGSKVSAPIADLNDWCYVDPQNDVQGCYTRAAVQKASRRGRTS